MATSFFYKHFTDPIEAIIQPAIDLRQSSINAKSAQKYGLELEFRRNLRFLSARLAHFRVQANFTFVDSNVVIPDDQALLLTSRGRPDAMGQRL